MNLSGRSALADCAHIGMAREGLVEVFVVSVESGGSGVLVPLVRGIMGLRSEGEEGPTKWTLEGAALCCSDLS